MISQIKLPFTYDWIVYRMLDNYKTVLDLGCSDGDLMSRINANKKFVVTGVDVFKPALKIARKSGVYKELIYGDIRNLKLGQKFDVVLSSQVIEHLTKNDGLRLIKTMEKYAKKRIIIATTVGYLPYNPLEGDDSGNNFQEHKSGWEVDEFKNLGYKVYGQGTRFFYREGGPLRRLPSFIFPFIFFVSYLLAPLNFLFPKQSAYLQIAVKDL